METSVSQHYNGPAWLAATGSSRLRFRGDATLTTRPGERGTGRLGDLYEWGGEFSAPASPALFDLCGLIVLLILPADDGRPGNRSKALCSAFEVPERGGAARLTLLGEGIAPYADRPDYDEAWRLA